MSDELLKRLFFDSQEQDAAEADLEALIEALAGVKDLEVSRKPLETAVRKLGVKDGEFEVAEGDVVTLKFTDMSAFRNAVVALTDINKLVQLAEMGWIAVVEGDVASQAEGEPVLRINFIPVGEPELSKGEKPIDMEKVRDQMNEPGAEDLTGNKARRREVPKGVGKDAAHLSAKVESEESKFKVHVRIVSGIDDGKETVWEDEIVVSAPTKMGVKNAVLRYLEKNVTEWDERVDPRMDIISIESEVEESQDKVVVWVKEDGKWVENGDGPMTWKEGERVAKELRKECGCPTRVAPVGMEPFAKPVAERMEDEWGARVRTLFGSLPEFEAYDKKYGVARKTGFNSAKEMWDANAGVHGGSAPHELRRGVRGESIKEHRANSEHVARAFIMHQTAAQDSSSTDGQSLLLHGNKIAEWRGNNIFVSLAGWNTSLTRDRLSALMSVAYGAGRVYQKGGVPIIELPGREPVQLPVEAGQFVDLGPISRKPAEANMPEKAPLPKWKKVDSGPRARREDLDPEAQTLVDRLLDGEEKKTDE